MTATPAYQPLYDGIDPVAEARSRPPRRRGKKSPPTATKPAVVVHYVVLGATITPPIGHEQPLPTDTPRRAVITEPAFELAVLAAPPVPILYVTEDLRSIAFTGANAAWPDRLTPGYCVHFGLDPAAPLFRLSPRLWEKVRAAVALRWAELGRLPSRDTRDAEKNALLDRVAPILEFARAAGWPVSDNSDYSAGP